jgi:hypothetical protein
MAKPMTIEEAREWIRANRGRLQQKLEGRENLEDLPDLPDECTPGGMTLSPETELELRRLLREIQQLDDEAEGDDDDR